MQLRQLVTAIIALVVFATTTQQAAAADTIRVLTDRTESHLKPLFEHFTATTGIDIEAVYVDKGLMARLQAQPTEADVVLSKNAENLERARIDGLLQPIHSEAVAALAEQFRDPDMMYMITSYRARGLYVSKERVEPGAIQTYEDLCKPALHGKVAIRSGFHSYNISLFCQMAESEGLDAAKAFIDGLKSNLCRSPKGNDRAQVQAIHDGLADVSIGNSYYLGIMMGRDDQRPWALASDVIFPNQQGKGAYVMQAAAGLTTSDRNVSNATMLLDYLISDFAQYYLTSTLHVYSVKPNLPISAFNKTLGANQLEVVDGKWKANFVPLRAVDRHREEIVAYLTSINFDQ